MKQTVKSHRYTSYVDDDEVAMRNMRTLRKKREQLGLFQKKLGEKLGISGSALGNYERGDYPCPVEVYNGLAEIFGWEKYMSHRSILNTNSEDTARELTLPFSIEEKTSNALQDDNVKSVFELTRSEYVVLDVIASIQKTTIADILRKLVSDFITPYKATIEALISLEIGRRIGEDEMIEWKFNAADYNPDRFQLIPPGKYRVRIESAEEAMSRTGKQMVKMTLKVSGYNSRVWYNMVFDNTDNESVSRTNDRLGQLCDSFNIPLGELNLSVWKGKVGAAEIGNEKDDKGVERARVKWFIPRKAQDSLPAWQEHPIVAPASDMASIEEMPF